MVSCLFCRKKVWHQRGLSDPFKDHPVTTYYCKACKIYIQVIKYVLPENPTGTKDSVSKQEQITVIQAVIKPHKDGSRSSRTRAT